MRAGLLLLVVAIGVLIPAASAAQPTVFNLTESLRVVNYTWASFCPRSLLKPWSCQWCTDPTMTVIDVVRPVVICGETISAAHRS